MEKERKTQAMNGKKPLKMEHWAAIAALVFGLMTHMFGLINVLHNWDSIATPEGYAASATSGRWFLDVIALVIRKPLVGSYTATWLTGILTIVFLALAAWVLTATLKLRSRGTAVALGMALASFPTVESTLMFRFTAPAYAIALVFSIGAVWFLREKKRGLVPGVALIICAMGIYQAYLPFTVALFVVCFLRDTLAGQEKGAEIFRKGLRACLAILLGVIGYIFLTRLIVKLSGQVLDSYQGLDQMGQVPLRDLPGRMAQAFLGFFTMPADSYDLLQSTFMELVFYGTLALGLGVTVWRLLRLRRLDLALLAGFLWLALPLAVNFIVVMGPEYIYTLMVYPYVLVMLLPLLLLEVCPLPEGKLARAVKKGVSLALVVWISCNVYYTNVNYQIQHFTTRQTENYAAALVTQVRMTEGFTPDKTWAFLGKVDDPLLDNYWVEMNDYFGYGGNSTAPGLLRNYSWDRWLAYYTGYTVPVATEAELEALYQLEQVRNMPQWPAYGSVQAVGEYMVIKFEPLEPITP